MAAVQIIVYGGAIMVLFVFVIMLLNAGSEEHTSISKMAGARRHFAGAGVDGLHRRNHRALQLRGTGCRAHRGDGVDARYIHDDLQRLCLSRLS